MFFSSFYYACGVVLLAELAFSSPVPQLQNYFYPNMQAFQPAFGQQPCVGGSPSCSTGLVPAIGMQLQTPLLANCGSSCSMNCGTTCQLSCATCQAPCPMPCPTPCPMPCPLPCPMPCPERCPTICPTPPPTPPPTKPPVICPPGTIKINNFCHIIYCGRGIFVNGRCIQTICPSGTAWSGSRCELIMPQNQTTIHISNVITNNINQTDVNEINYTNNINVNITDLAETTSPGNCCTIITPDVCQWNQHQYTCGNRRYTKCGTFCTNSYVALRAPTVVSLPPPPCTVEPCYEPFYPDCSLCVDRSNQYCRTYCQKSECLSSSCHSMDLAVYCSSYPGSIGCRTIDGCYGDWCR